MMAVAKTDIRSYLTVQLLVLLMMMMFCSTKLFMKVEATIISTTTTPVYHKLGNETDKLSLLAFKQGISNDPFGVFKYWNDSSHFCQWHGITCGRCHSSRVVALGLQGNRLVGSISPFIGNLSFLRSINLGNNSFHSRIPQEMGKLLRLQNLDLSSNSLEGEIPSNLSHCLSIESLDLSNNMLVGRVPTELAALSKLESFLLPRNILTGSFPSFISNISSLKTIAIDYNGFEGSIPYTIAKLSSLEMLSIVGNRFSGTLPSSLYNISSMKVLIMASNKLHGYLPPDIGFTLPNLIRFGVAENQFSGTIPNSFSNASRLLRLDMPNNNFVGQVPTNLGSLQNLRKLGLAANHLGSSTTDDLNFLNSLTNCTKLEILGIHDNQFGGVLPDSISNFSIQLALFGAGRNQISGSIPTGIGNLVNLEALGLEENVISGNIPSSLGKLRKLQRLFLNTNRLTGEIPYTLGNMSQLIELDLGSNNLEGNIPSALGMFSHLLFMGLDGNNLSGTIPKQIMGLSSLSIGLSLSHNSLTGFLASEVGNLKNLETLYVSHNNLTGEIPASLGSCLGLQYLRLDHNFFVGKIPTTLSPLKGISELDLSHNNLSGPIPKFLESFHLQKLNLSFNDLEGEVPKEGVFKNLSAVSLRGNVKLCGGVVQLHFPKCNSTQSTEKGRHLPRRVLIAILSLVACLLLLVFVASTCWIRRSRKKVPPTSSMENKFTMMKLSYEDLFKGTGGFSSANLIGSGSFGCVYKGILDQIENAVAVKVLDLQQRGASKTFKAECKALRNIKHRNLIKIITSVSSIDSKGNDFKALVFEFMPNGSLDHWLHPAELDELNQSRNLSLLQRLDIVIDVASALDYLHHHSHTRIIHCDLKPSNVLLDHDMTAHLGDFGLARLFSCSTQNSFSNQSSTIGMKGSIGYTAPEYGIGSEASTQGDVFSFGILLLEMLTGKRPTDEMFRDGLSLHIFVKMAIPERVMQIVDPRIIILEEAICEIEDSSRREKHNQRRENMLNCIVQLTRIGVACSLEAPRERMDMANVIRQLHLVRDTFLSSENT